MMYIIIRGAQDITWHIGEKLQLTDREMLDVQLVQADGHELQYVADNMRNVPANTHRRVNRWTGDMAKFIAGNL